MSDDPFLLEAMREVDRIAPAAPAITPTLPVKRSLEAQYCDLILGPHWYLRDGKFIGTNGTELDELYVRSHRWLR